MAVMQRGGYGVIAIAIQPTNGPQNQRMQQREQEAVDDAGNSSGEPTSSRESGNREGQEQDAQKRVDGPEMQEQQVVCRRSLQLIIKK